jgi:hypothetical protein
MTNRGNRSITSWEFMCCSTSIAVLQTITGVLIQDYETDPLCCPILSEQREWHTKVFS